MPIVPLFGRGFTSKSPTVTDQLLVNMYREPQGDPDKTSMALYGTPGLVPISTFVPAAPNTDLTVRCMRQVGNYLWFVVGGSGGTSSLLYMSSSGAVTQVSVAGITTNQGQMGITDNGQQILLVDGVGGYTIAVNAIGAPAGSLTVISNANFPNGASTATCLNGYFIVDNPNATPRGRFNWSALNNATSWAALDYATAESNPDPLVHVIANFGQLFLFGTATTEIWAPSRDAAIFRRVGAAGTEWGLAARWSLSKYANNSLIFLGKNKLGQSQLVRMDNYTVTPLTDPDVTNDLNTRNVSGATGYSYSLDAHTFYQLNFPDKSYLYDDLSQSYSQVISDGGRHFGEIRAELNAIAYVSDYRNANIYTVSATTYTYNSTPIIREITSRHLFHDLDFLSVWELVLDVETGDGLVTGQGSNPQIMLQISKDNGRTWGNERWTTMGALGEYLTRVVWRQLGVGRDRLFKFRVSDPVKVVITCGSVNVA